MKKTITTLIMFAFAFLFHCNVAMAAEEVVAKSDNDYNWQIVKVGGDTYRLEAIDISKKVNFENQAPEQNDFKRALGTDQAAQQANAAFQSCTGTLVLSGDFQNINAFNNNRLSRFKTVNLSAAKFYQSYGDNPPRINFTQNNEYRLKQFFKDTENLILPGDEIVDMHFFEDGNQCKLKSLVFSTGTKQVIGSLNTQIIGKIPSFTSVTFNADLEVIGAGAFYECNGLQAVDFPAALKTIGPQAFMKCLNILEVDFSGTVLETIDYQAFDSGKQTHVSDDTGRSKLAKVTLPATLKNFANYVFSCTSIKELDFSMCTDLVRFMHDGQVQGEQVYKTFYWYDSVEKIILPPNLTYLMEAVFDQCTKLKALEFPGEAHYTNGVLDNGLTIEKNAAQYISTLQSITFANNSNLYQINASAFQGTDLRELDLSMCHELRYIKGHAFANIPNLALVKVCSHKKTISGPRGGGAFNESTAIRRVEVTACPGVTDITECVCENGGFDAMVTYHQTDANLPIDEIYSQCALLVFPENANVPSTSPYKSAYDYFYGEYKTKTLIYQESLEGLYKDVPQEGTGSNKLWVPNEHFETVTVPYQIGNGWHEFLATDFAEIIPQGKFLRTYSRSKGDGPCILPKEITAYRAVDYQTSTKDYVLDKNGEYYFNGSEYILIDKVNGKFDSATLKLIKDNGYSRYSLLTVGGKVYLRPLVAYQAMKVNNVTIPYNDEAYNSEMTNKEFYDDLIYNKTNPNYADIAMPAATQNSYVPENTGVVLYSMGVNEEALLVLGGYFGTETVLPEYENTEDAYEANRKATEPDNINMLKGSYDELTLVAPVSPWTGQDPQTGAGGQKAGPVEYRNFAFKKNDAGDGGLWMRLQPSKLRLNRAYVAVPYVRFDNFNETAGQSPEWTKEDVPTTGQSVGLSLINFFEGESESEADGIQTVNTVTVNATVNAWYTLQGVRLSQPPTKGIYIHNGKKVVIN